MKLRVDYVTNSSSSSFVIVNKVNDCDELRAYMKEEYGKYGIRLLDSFLCKGEHITVSEDDRYVYINTPDGGTDEYYFGSGASDITFENNNLYLFSRHYQYTTEGDEPGDDAWLEDHLPEEYIEEIYRTEDY